MKKFFSTILISTLIATSTFNVTKNNLYAVENNKPSTNIQNNTNETNEQIVVSKNTQDDSLQQILTDDTSNVESNSDTASFDIVATSAFLIDYNTGRVLYAKNADKKIYPASTTKMWTAYNVLKNVKDLDTVIKIEDLPAIDGSSMYLTNGEQFTIKQLLQALLIHSSNDAAFVLARYVGGGDVTKFIDMMNAEAKSIGCSNTHFNNPHGLPDENHYTTAHDMALMARVAMSNSIFREIVKTEFISFAATKEYPYVRYFANTNKFLSSKETMNYKGKQVPMKYGIVDGIKTGYTDAAGKCLLTSATKDNRRVICAVFQSTNEGVYLDSRTLLDYGLDNYYNEYIVNSKDSFKSEPIYFSQEKELLYKPENNYYLTLDNNEQKNYITKDNFSVKTHLNVINKDIKKGDVVGHINVYLDDKEVKKINLIAQNNVTGIFGIIPSQKLIIISGLSIVSLLVLIIVLFKIRANSRKKDVFVDNK
ncbi:MAG: D-alanyl-D-alanine carboxypeptidase [Clostridioides sp.]|jgi:D-alanyl-D-alanine carboxypeptidase (penicillin-binding protein 5/6)|nr:D-alanyl-D-alanine carboxypeptidase [Clostridioides sp.]